MLSLSLLLSLSYSLSSDQLSERSHVSTTALWCSQVAEIKSHLFSCPGQLKRLWVLQTITWHFWTGFLLAEYWCVFSYYFIINVIIYVVNNRTNSVYQTQKPHFKRSRLGTYLMMAHIHGTSFPAAVSPPIIRSIKDSPQPFRWQWKHILGISPTAGGCGLGGLRSSPPSQGQVQRGAAEVDLDLTRGTWGKA